MAMQILLTWTIEEFALLDINTYMHRKDFKIWCHYVLHLYLYLLLKLR